MSEFKGTPGPWRVDETKALGAYGVWTDCTDGVRQDHVQICSVVDREEFIRPRMPREQRDANARRIVACVNGCKGINPDAVPDLLAALRPFANFACDEPHVNEPPCQNCIARAAFARATKGSE